MATELHLIYLATPVNFDMPIPMDKYYDAVTSLSKIDLQVVERVGVSLGQFIRWKRAEISSKRLLQPLPYKKMYAALILYNLMSETPEETLKQNFGITKG